MLLGLDGIDRGEAKAEETVVTDVLLELGAHLLGELNGLVGERGLANGDGVGVDIAARARLVTVGDAPGVPLELVGGAGLRWVINDMTIDLVGGSLGREHPTIDMIRDVFRKRCKDGSLTDLKIQCRSRGSAADHQW